MICAIPAQFVPSQHNLYHPSTICAIPAQCPLRTVKWRKDNRIGHSWRGNCLLKYAIEGKIEGTVIRGRRRMQLLDNLRKPQPPYSGKNSTPVRTKLHGVTSRKTVGTSVPVNFVVTRHPNFKRVSGSCSWSRLWMCGAVPSLRRAPSRQWLRRRVLTTEIAQETAISRNLPVQWYLG